MGTLLWRKKDTQTRAVKIEAVALTAEPHYITAPFMTGSYLEAGAWVENGKRLVTHCFGELSMGKLGLWADSSASRCMRRVQLV